MWVNLSLKKGRLEGQNHHFFFDNWKWCELDRQSAKYKGQKDIEYSGVRDINQPIYNYNDCKASCLWRRCVPL